jgi:ATP-dependent protease Clp ATPase subunit
VGRLPLIITFAPLTAADLVSIIDHDDVSPLAAWRRYLGPALGADLQLDEAAKWVVAERAEALGMGARGLQHVLFPVVAERTRDVATGASPRDILLRAADFMPEAALPMATRVQ